MTQADDAEGRVAFSALSVVRRMVKMRVSVAYRVPAGSAAQRSLIMQITENGLHLRHEIRTVMSPAWRVVSPNRASAQRLLH